jgi:hypothetical protein
MFVYFSLYIETVQRKYSIVVMVMSDDMVAVIANTTREIFESVAVVAAIVHMIAMKIVVKSMPVLMLLLSWTSLGILPVQSATRDDFQMTRFALVWKKKMTAGIKTTVIFF